MTNKTEIFKIQRPLITNGHNNNALIYNEDRSIKIETLITEDILKAFNGDFKMYAEMITNTEDNSIAFIKRVETQNW